VGEKEALEEVRSPGRPERPPGGISEGEEDDPSLQGSDTGRRLPSILQSVILGAVYGSHIPHNRIHEALKEMSLARDQPRKQLMKKWIRYERRYSN